MARTAKAQSKAGRISQSVVALVSRHATATNGGKQPMSETVMPRGRPRADARTVDLDWFKERLQKLRLSQRALASVLARDVSILNRTLAGTREATAGEVARIAIELGVSTDEVLRRLGYNVPQAGVTIAGAVRADGRVTSISARAGHLLQLPPLPPGVKALVAETRGGPLEGYDGAVFLYQESKPGHVPPDAIGRLCVVEAADEVVPLLGTLSRADRRGHIRFQPFCAGEVRDLSAVLRASIVVRIILQ